MLWTITHHPCEVVAQALAWQWFSGPLSEEQVEWADLILVMEKEHRNRLNRKFGKALGGKRVVFNIPDVGL